MARPGSNPWNVDCSVTNRNKDQDSQADYKTTNLKLLLMPWFSFLMPDWPDYSLLHDNIPEIFPMRLSLRRTLHVFPDLERVCHNKSRISINTVGSALPFANNLLRFDCLC